MVREVAERLVGSVLEYLYAEFPGLLLTAVDDGVLLADGRNDGLGADGEVGQRREADVDVDHGRLLAVEGHFLHAVDRHEGRFQPLGPVAQLRPRESPVDGEAVIDAVNVAEIVGDGDLRRPGGQFRLDVEHLAAQFVPQLGNLRSGRGGVQFDLNFRDPVIGFGGDFVDQSHRLNLAFDRLGDELLDLPGRGSRIGADERRRLDDEDRVLLLAQRGETQRTAGQQDEEEEPDYFGTSQGIFGQVHRSVILKSEPVPPRATDRHLP